MKTSSKTVPRSFENGVVPRPLRQRMNARAALATGTIATLACISCKDQATPPLPDNLRGELITSNATNHSQPSAVSNSDTIISDSPGLIASSPAPNPSAQTTPIKEPADSASFAVLSGFNYRLRYVGSNDQPEEVLRPIDPIPPDIKAYDGRRVTITGFVMPLRTQGRDVTEFLLTRDQSTCCFGAVAQMNHWIHVKVKRSEFRPSIFLPVTVTGKLEVGEVYEEGMLQSIYRIQAERVEKVQPPTPPRLPDWLQDEPAQGGSRP